MSYEIITGAQDVLTTPCEKFDFDDPPHDPVELAQTLVKLMRDNQGIGLAANQIGIPYRVFALRGDPNRVLFNPRIVAMSEKQVYLEEGCLSFPGVICKIKRPEIVKIRYAQPNQEVKTESFVGMTARVCQHEIDHLDGILFYNRATRYHREQALKKFAKMQIRIADDVFVPQP